MTRAGYLSSRLYSRGTRESYISNNHTEPRDYNLTNPMQRPYALHNNSLPYSGKNDYSPLESASVL